MFHFFRFSIFNHQNNTYKKTKINYTYRHLFFSKKKGNFLFVGGRSISLIPFLLDSKKKQISQ